MHAQPQVHDPASTDIGWMRVALSLAERGIGRTWPSPSVGCVIVRDGIVVGCGDTKAGGRPHAEFVALTQAGDAARGATAYCTLEPCAHDSRRGPTCSSLLIEAGIARVVTAMTDPDPRTRGQGHARLQAAGINVETGICGEAARALNLGFILRLTQRRPMVTLKLALSIDGCLALASGESRWITGPQARTHTHLERSRHDVIIVGRGTADADDPGLDVRIQGLEVHSPLPFILSRSLTEAKPGSRLASRGARILTQETIAANLAWLADEGVTRVMVEGGAGVAASFLAADLVDRLLIYRAPIVIGGGRGSVGDIGLTDLGHAHGRWRKGRSIGLGEDQLEVYLRHPTE
jgi:diaminohydroxyphosphoribosylaminopyrimidine deaminase / 5-amino-6-(5-phosphoribosylamino)uracil reductase